jgi:uncharacterized protein YbaA (DUF1428 family)
MAKLRIYRLSHALKFVECWGDDVPEGKVTSFPMAVKRKDDENEPEAMQQRDNRRCGCQAVLL